MRGVVTLALAALLLGACGGGGGSGDAAPAPEERRLPLDRLSIGAPLNGEARVTVLKEIDADAGPYTATLTPADCGTSTVDGSGIVVSGLKVGKCELTIRAAAAAVSIPVEVFDPYVLATDELELAYTTEFAHIGNFGTLSFYRPVHRDPGFLAFGTVIGSSVPVTQRAIVMVKPKQGSTAVLSTMEYETQISGAVHKAICPAGYRALGLVWTLKVEKPAFPTACIRNDLTTLGNNTRRIMDGPNLRAFAVDLPVSPDPHTEHFFPPDTAIGVAQGDKPAEDGYVLKVKLPVVAEAPRLVRLPVLLNSLCEFRPIPLSHTTVRIPFTAFPSTLSDKERATTSPFYSLERYVAWSRVACLPNDVDRDRVETYEYKAGVTTAASQTYHQETAIEISFEAGVEIGAFSSKVGTTLSTSFGYSRTTEVSEFSERTVTDQWTIPARSSGAIFNQTSSFRLYRYAGKEMVLDDPSKTLDIAGHANTVATVQFKY
jgi:hypothetical protein